MAKPTPAPPPSAYIPGLAFAEMYQAGVQAWMALFVQSHRMMTEAAQKSFGSVGGGLSSGTVWPWLPDMETLRAELLITGAQAEAAADAVRQTLVDLGAPEERTPILPD